MGPVGGELPKAQPTENETALLERLVTTARSNARSDFKRNPICQRIAVMMTER
jgi:hypothetical protein